MKKNKARVLLINPPESLVEANSSFSPSLGLLYLAGTLLNNGIETEIVDGFYESWKEIKKKIKEYQPDIIGISCFSPTRHKALRVARIAKKINKDVLVVMGGMHVTHMYEQVLSNYPEVDICVIGEGERTLLEIAQDKELLSIKGIAFRKDGIILTEKRERIKNLDDIPFPAWHLVNWDKYPSRMANVTISRGCVGHCSFCSVWKVWKKWRHRSAENIINELELLNKKYNITQFNFADDSFTINKQLVLDLCKEIQNRNLQITFVIATRADYVDEELLIALKNAGCNRVLYGIESGSPEILKKMDKPIDIKDAKRAIALSNQVGIETLAAIIGGYFGETIETINQTIDFLNEAKPDRVGSRPGLFIFPGTTDYLRCKKIGFIDDSFWLKKKCYKIYTKEHNILKIIVFYVTITRRQKLFKWWIINYFNHIPYYIRHMIIIRYIPEPVRIMYHNFKVRIISIFK